MSKIIKLEIIDLDFVATRMNTKLVWLRNVIELSVVAGCHGFEAVADVVAVKLVKQSYEGKIMRRNPRPCLSTVCIAEGGVSTRLHPFVDTVHADECFEFVCSVTLVYQLGEGISCHLFVFCTSLGDLDEFLGVSELVAEAVEQRFVLLLVVVDLRVGQELLPIVVPGCTIDIPGTRTWLGFVKSNSREIVNTVLAHVDILLVQELLVGGDEILAEALR